jgi:quercetin dioxygenase-like cupin family protein
MKIISKGERTTRKGSAEWFVGDAWIDGVVVGEAPSRLQAAYVTFTPGARTNWHTHPVSQVLNVVSGVGWVQLEGQPARQIVAGDVVVIGPGENHWHGAQANYGMVHLAMQESDDTGSVVTWGRAVSEEEYGAAER